MKKQYTKKQIEETINHWANYLLESNLASENEVKDLLGEGWMRRLGHSIKNAAKKTKEIAHEINWLPQKMWDKVFKPNKGVEMTLDAMNRIEKDGKVALKNVNIFASIAGTVYPIVGFALLKHKTVLVLLLNNEDHSAKPKTLGDLRKFLIDAKVNIKAAVDSIRIALAPASLSESILLEANAVDRLIDKNGWTKKQALEPENLKALKKAFKQNEKKTIEKIEKHFAATASKPASKVNDPTSTSSKDSVKSKSSGDDQDTSADTELEFPTLDDASDASTTDKDASKKSPSKKSPKDTIKILDNELIKVVPDKKTGDKNIGFVFTKSKAEIAIDKKEADMLS